MRTILVNISASQQSEPFAMPAIRVLAALAFATLAALGSAQAAEPEALLVIKNHRFEPAELKVPAGQRVKLVVHNQDSTPEEFESHTMNREKVIPAGAKATIYIGPLKPGRYDFYGEYNEATAKGVVVAE
jgi:plastocyanin